MRYVLVYGYAYFYEIVEGVYDNDGKGYTYREVQALAEKVKERSDVAYVQICIKG